MVQASRTSRLAQFFDKRQVVIQMATVVAVVSALVVGAAAMVGYWTASSIDAQAIARERGFVDEAVAHRFARVPVDQESVTLWDDAVQAANANDQAWIDENLGVWMATYFGHDRVYVLDRNDEPTYAMRTEISVAPAGYAADRASVAPLVAKLRARMATASAGLADSTEAIAALGIEDIVLMRGRPAIVSIKPIVPSSDRLHQAPGTEYLHVSVVFIGRTLLGTVSHEYAITDLRLVYPDRIAGLPAVALKNTAGDTLGYFQWQPYLPGQATIARLGPPFLLAVLLGSLLVGWLLRRLWRSTMLLQAGEEHTRFLAFHDPLTGLPNRALFDDRLDQALVLLNDPRHRPIALHLIDIDRFKVVNDTFGHPIGDELVRQIAGRLTAVVRVEDTIARIGGDEFVIVQVDVSDEADALEFADRILKAFQPMFDLGGEHTAITASIGVAVAAAPGVGRAELLRRADIALYEAKDRGRGRVEVFADEMDDAVQRRRSIERDLRVALETGVGLDVAYQPLFAADASTIVGAEALVRWSHPQLGQLAPIAFISVAEERGMIEPLGEWVLTQACAMLQRTNLPKVAVNVSPLQLRNRRFPLRALEILHDAGIEPSRLEIEVTEGVLIEEGPLVEDALKQLRARGVAIVLDDFGTGYSSMSYLHRYAVDKIKIDQSFVQKLGGSGEADAIVTAIVSLARAMRRHVTAEGIETAEQCRHLADLGCDELQGYYLSRPLLLADFEAFLARPPEAVRRSA